MTPQTQEFLHTEAQAGDCARAVIASLLDLPIAQVPHFAQLAEGAVWGFYSRINDFLESHGFEMAWQASPAYHLRDGQDIYHYISGPSPRGVGFHAVVGLNGRIFFDPHPSRDGLAGDASGWSCSFLTRLKTC